MTTYPITLHAREVEGIQSGRQTQLRRVLDPQPKTQPFRVLGERSGDWFTQNREYPRRGALMSGRWRCPHGKPGDLILGREITAVRVDRLQEISENDASLEGVILTQPSEQTYYGEFHRLWESTHGPGSWNNNPWVWVIELGKSISPSP